MANAHAASMNVHATVRGCAPGRGLGSARAAAHHDGAAFFRHRVRVQRQLGDGAEPGLADYHFMVRQLVGGAIGLVGLVRHGADRLPPSAPAGLAAARRWSSLALILVIMPGTEAIAPRVNGARRWLTLGPLQIQPSEFAKFALIVWTAALAVKKQDKLSSLTRGLLPFLLVWALVAGLIFLRAESVRRRDRLLLAALVVFAAGARIGHFILLAVVVCPSSRARSVRLPTACAGSWLPQPHTRSGRRRATRSTRRSSRWAAADRSGAALVTACRSLDSCPSPTTISCSP